MLRSRAAAVGGKMQQELEQQPCSAALLQSDLTERHRQQAVRKDLEGQITAHTQLLE